MTTHRQSAKVYDLGAYYLARRVPRSEIDIAALRVNMTPAMRKIARRIEHLVRAQGVSLGTAAWCAWDRHPRLKAWQVMAARDLAGWRLSQACLTRRRASV